jgi:hypothetical protein
MVPQLSQEFMFVFSFYIGIVVLLPSVWFHGFGFSVAFISHVKIGQFCQHFDGSQIIFQLDLKL